MTGSLPVLPGVDVVSVVRIAELVERRPAFLDRVFTARELADVRRGEVELGSAVAARRLAARFAAKEAARKALGIALGWQDVEVVTEDDGRPTLHVHGRPSDRAAVSLAHDGDVAIAFVLATPTTATTTQE